MEWHPDKTSTTLNPRVVALRHVNETQKEVSDLLEKEEKSAVQIFDQVGMLGETTVLAHCVFMTDEDISLLS